MVSPGIDDQVAVDPEAHTVIGMGAELIRAGFQRLHLPDPASRKCIWPNFIPRRAAAPKEVHHRVGPREDAAGEVLVVEIGACKAVSLALRMCGRRRYVRVSREPDRARRPNAVEVGRAG